MLDNFGDCWTLTDEVFFAFANTTNAHRAMLSTVKKPILENILRTCGVETVTTLTSY